MSDYHLRTAEQLTVLLQAFRKESGLTQSEVALRLGCWRRPKIDPPTALVPIQI